MLGIRVCWNMRLLGRLNSYYQRVLVNMGSPCYEGLRNNVPTPLMRTKLNAWPSGTPDFVSHVVMKKYIQDTSKKAGVDGVTIYGARVKKLCKQDGGWKVNWSTLREDDGSGVVQEEEHSEVGATATDRTVVLTDCCRHLTQSSSPLATTTRHEFLTFLAYRKQRHYGRLGSFTQRDTEDPTDLKTR